MPFEKEIEHIRIFQWEIKIHTVFITIFNVYWAFFLYDFVKHSIIVDLVMDAK